MKKFVQILLMTLVVVEGFLFFGGYAVFDFSRRYYTAGAACAFIISLILYGFLVQAEKIEELEKRIQEIETVSYTHLDVYKRQAQGTVGVPHLRGQIFLVLL